MFGFESSDLFRIWCFGFGALRQAVMLKHNLPGVVEVEECR